MPKGSRGKYKEWLKPENLTLIQGWRRDGLSDAQIAKNIGINQATIYVWRNKYAEFNNAYKKGSEVCLTEVENALFKSAIGYDVTETEQIEVTEPDGRVTITKRARKRHIPPNTGSICFILKNRLPDKYKDRPLNLNQNEGMLEALIDGLREAEPEEEVIETIEATEIIDPDLPEMLPGDNTA